MADTTGSMLLELAKASLQCAQDRAALEAENKVLREQIEYMREQLRQAMDVPKLVSALEWYADVRNYRHLPFDVRIPVQTDCGARAREVITQLKGATGSCR